MRVDRRVRRCGWLLASFLWDVGGVFARGPERVLLESSLEPHTVQVGDRLVLTVNAVAPVGTECLPLALPRSLGAFEVVNVDTGTAVSDGNALRQTIRLTLTVFEVGVSTLPPVTFRFQKAGGAGVYEQATPEIPVTITSVLTNQSKDIRGPKGQLPKVMNEVFWGTLGLVLLIGGGLYGVKRFFGKKNRAVVPPGPPPSPPDVVALSALARLEVDMEGPGKIFYSRLSDIARTYLEGRFQVPALDRTTSEIIQGFKGMPLTVDQRLRLREVLDSSDLAKFAKMELTVEERLKHLIQVRDFVNVTRPAPEAERSR